MNVLHFLVLLKVCVKGVYYLRFLFRFYIRDLIFSITCTNVGCKLLGINVNLLAYADDLVLLAKSWVAL